MEMTNQTAYPDSDALIRDYAARQRLARIAVEKVMKSMEDTMKADLISECGCEEVECDGGISCRDFALPTATQCKRCLCAKCSQGKCKEDEQPASRPTGQEEGE